MVRVRVEATRKEVALITQAARRLGLTPSQFVTRAATRRIDNPDLPNIAGRKYTPSGKTTRPKRKP